MCNMSMRGRITIGFSVVLLLAVAIATFGIIAMRNINKQADFVKLALVPQMDLAVGIEMQMRDTVRSMGHYAITADERYWQEAMLAQKPIRANMMSLSRLAAEYPELEQVRLKLELFPPELARFERACQAIRMANANMNQAMDTMLKAGPVATDILNELMDRSFVDIRKAATAGNLSEIQLIMLYMDRYNTLYDSVETLRNDQFTALVKRHFDKLDEIQSRYGELAKTFATLREDLQQYPEIGAKMNAAVAAFTNMQATTTAFVNSRNELAVAEIQLNESHTYTVQLSRSLVERSEVLTQNIAQQMSEYTEQNVWILAAVTGVVLVVGSLCAWWLLFTLSGQAQLLLNGAQALSEGRFDTRSNTDSGAERGYMTRNENRALDMVEDKMLWYEAILDVIPAPIIVTDLHRNWTFVNRAAEEILRCSRQEAIGRPCSELQTELCGTIKCPIECLKQGLHRHTLHHNDNDYVVDVTYLINRNGDTIGYVEMFLNITSLPEESDNSPDSSVRNSPPSLPEASDDSPDSNSNA